MLPASPAMRPNKTRRKQSVAQTDLSGFVQRAESTDEQIFVWLEIKH
jgi:hypothetical protein